MKMNRRDALNRVALIMGGTLSAPSLMAFSSERHVPGVNAASTDFPFSAEQKKLVIEVADTILPRTKTPGAKDAGIGEFMETVLRDCYGKRQHDVFIKGLDELAKKDFLNLSQADRDTVIKELALTSKNQGRAAGVSFFRLIKELTLFGYFNSEKGATLALDYLPVPGRYDGLIDLKPGQRSWS